MHQALQGAPPTPENTLHSGTGKVLGKGKVFSQGLRLLGLCTPGFPRARAVGRGSPSQDHTPNPTAHQGQHQLLKLTKTCPESLIF